MYTAKFLLHQSPTRHCDYTVTRQVTMYSPLFTAGSTVITQLIVTVLPAASLQQLPMRYCDYMVTRQVTVYSSLLTSGSTVTTQLMAHCAVLVYNGDYIITVQSQGSHCAG